MQKQGMGWEDGPPISKFRVPSFFPLLVLLRSLHSFKSTGVLDPLLRVNRPDRFNLLIIIVCGSMPVTDIRVLWKIKVRIEITDSKMIVDL